VLNSSSHAKQNTWVVAVVIAQTWRFCA